MKNTKFTRNFEFMVEIEFMVEKLCGPLKTASWPIG